MANESRSKAQPSRWAAGMSVYPTPSSLPLPDLLMLGLVWYREHALKDQAVGDLKESGIRFPSTPRWKGVATAMIMGMLFGSAFIWLVLLVAAIFAPEILVA